MKKLTSAAVAAMIALSVSAAYAAPVDINGDVKAHYRWTTEAGSADTDGGKLTFRLNAKVALDKNSDFYARLAGQALNGDKIGADFNTDKYGSSVAEVDQYGFIFRNSGFEYKLGKQGVSITPTALLYSSEGYLGESMSFITGLTATGKLGVTSVQVVVGENDSAVGNDDNRVYSVHGSYSPAKDWTIGGTVARSKAGSADAVAYYGIDASYNLGKASFVADYLKSDQDTKNTAHILGVSYAFDTKNSFSVYAHKTGSNSHIATDWDPGQKGYYFIYDHKFSKDYALNLLYRDNEAFEAGKKDNTSFRTTVTYKF